LTRAAADKADEEDETNSWLKLVDGLDYSARVLILYCLTQAAEATRDKSAEWITLAEAAGTDEGIELPIFRVIVDENNLLREPNPNEAIRERLQDRINRLEVFMKMASMLVSDLKERLRKLLKAE
jgi:hypothetical protein